MEKKFSKLEESMEAFMKSQTAFMQNQGTNSEQSFTGYIEIENTDEPVC